MLGSNSSLPRHHRAEAAVCLALLVLGCSATDEPRSGDGGGGSTGPAGQGGLGIGGGNSGKGVGCSPDLQTVIFADGSEKACPPDQGCHDGACIAACEAAGLSRGSIGCDFWAPDPPFFGNGLGGDPSISLALAGPCFAVFIANAWSRPGKITITRGGQTFDATQFGRIPKGIVPNVTYEPIGAEGLPPNEVGVLFLSHRPGVNNNGDSLECPVPPAVLDDAGVRKSGRGSAFHVSLDTPMSVYDIVPYGGASSWLPSATLLYPATAWGSNYTAFAPPEGGPLWVAAVAREDGTTLQVAPATIDLPGGASLAAAPAFQTTSYTLGAGEIVQWLGADPTGTVLQSDKPVGVWTGNTYLAVSSKTSPMGGGHDSAHQQLPSIRALGSEYVGAGIFTRLPSQQPESVPYRLLGVVQGTQLTFTPAPPPGVPPFLVPGQAAYFETTEPFVVRSQGADHPFAFSQYMPGTNSEATVAGCSAGPPCSLGDEEWVVLPPPQQFLGRYVFFVDPTYATTNLVVTRVKGDAGFADVELACLGTVSGWKAVGASGRFEVAHVDLVRGGVAVANCSTSRHEATSTGAFGITVWGTDDWSSYGYPAGGNAGLINQVVVPVPN